MESERLNRSPTGWGKSLRSVNTSPPEMDRVTAWLYKTKNTATWEMSKRKERLHPWICHLTFISHICHVITLKKKGRRNLSFHVSDLCWQRSEVTRVLSPNVCFCFRSLKLQATMKHYESACIVTFWWMCLFNPIIKHNCTCQFLHLHELNLHALS